MKVFITGVAGFLGSHLADEFLRQGHQVAGNDNLLGGYKNNIPEGVEFYQVDCNDLERMRLALARCDVVFHCAASAYEGLSVFSPHIITQNIVTATTGAVSAAIAVGAKRFVNCSSMARYGTNLVPFTEDMQPKPQDPYGIGKVAAEDILRNLCEVHNLEFVIAVPHNIIGPRQKYDDPFRNVASIFINLMLQGRQPFIYGEGKQKRCFSFVSDVVAPLAKMATHDAVVGEVINIGPDEEFVSINYLAETIAELLSFKLSPQYLPGRPKEVFLANCSADKARKLLGYEPTISLKDGLQNMIDWIKDKGTKEFSYHIPLEIETERTPRTWSERLM